MRPDQETAPLKDRSMYKTKIDLPEKLRRNVIVILNDRLADAIDLQSQAKQAHWNVKGPTFHRPARAVRQDLGCRPGTRSTKSPSASPSLGGTAEGTVAMAAKRSKLKNYPLSITAGKDHLFYLSTQLAVVRQGGALGDRGDHQARRRGHRRPVHRDIPRTRQISVVRRGSSARQGLSRRHATVRERCDMSDTAGNASRRFRRNEGPRYAARAAHRR